MKKPIFLPVHSIFKSEIHICNFLILFDPLLEISNEFMLLDIVKMTPSLYTWAAVKQTEKELFRKAVLPVKLCHLYWGTCYTRLAAAPTGA